LKIKLNELIFAKKMFNLINNIEEILEKIVFTDEASFTLDGEVNSQNYRLVSIDPVIPSYPFPLLFLSLQILVKN
jgi:hypothetical protein